MNKLPPEEYYKSLPKKRMASGVLFFDREGKLLIVKPNYKEGWLLPGGTVDEDESPRGAAIREVKEEVGLEMHNLDLICVDYTTPKNIKTESLQFIFLGGILNDEQISKIILQEEELAMFKFVSTDEMIPLLSPGSALRMPGCLKAVKEGKAFYCES